MKFEPITTDIVRALQSGGPDYYGQPSEQGISDGNGKPCRHCLKQTPAGAPMLILSYRPFPEDQPYAEVGPIFLCGNACEPAEPAEKLPEILGTSPDYLIKGYTADHRIKYGTGRIIPSDRIIANSRRIFDDGSVAYIHVRSARNNCYLCRITRDA